MKKYVWSGKRFLISLLFVFVMVLGIQLQAHADLILTLSDGSNTVSVSDGQAGDVNPVTGAVTYIGSFGVWGINVSTGLSRADAKGPYMDLNSVNESSAAGTLTITLTDTTFSQPSTAYTLHIGGTTGGTVNVSAYDPADANNPIAVLGPFSSGAFSGTASGTSSNDQTAMSLTTAIAHEGATVTSFNAELRPVPIPAALWLLGSGLVGLVGMRRRIE